MNIKKFWTINGVLLIIQIALGILSYLHPSWWSVVLASVLFVMQIGWNFKNKTNDVKLKGVMLYSLLTSSAIGLVGSVLTVIATYKKQDVFLLISVVLALLYIASSTSLVAIITRRLREEFFYGDKLSAWKEVNSITIVLMVSTIFLSRVDAAWVWFGLFVAVIHLIWGKHKPI